MSTLWKGLIALLALATVVSLVTLFGGSRPIGSENLIGKALPGFAAPLADGPLDGDSNVFTPAQADSADATAACDVELVGAFNSCRDLPDRAIVVFWNTDKSECVRQIDLLQQATERDPKLNVVALAFDNEKPEVARVAKENDWSVPVAVDRDGAVASLYAVTGCPSVFWALDQQVSDVKLGVQSTQALLREWDNDR